MGRSDGPNAFASLHFARSRRFGGGACEAHATSKLAPQRHGPVGSIRCHIHWERLLDPWSARRRCWCALLMLVLLHRRRRCCLSHLHFICSRGCLPASMRLHPCLVGRCCGDLCSQWLSNKLLAIIIELISRGAHDKHQSQSRCSLLRSRKLT